MYVCVNNSYTFYKEKHTLTILPHFNLNALSSDKQKY